MRDVAAPEAPPSTFTEFNVRQDKGKPHYIRLHDSVVKRLERELGGNPGSTGLLLGSIENGDSCTIAVEQFEPTAMVEGRIRAWKSSSAPRVVGYYRGNPRDSFALDPTDRKLFERCFPKDSRLVLLVRPPKEKPGTAMFFLGENGRFVADRATVEFPFNLQELGAEEPPAPAVAAASPTPAKPARGGLLWKIAVASVVVIASVFGLSELRVFDRPQAQPQPQPQQTVAPAPQPQVAADRPARASEPTVSVPATPLNPAPAKRSRDIAENSKPTAPKSAPVLVAESPISRPPAVQQPIPQPAQAPAPAAVPEFQQRSVVPAPPVEAAAPPKPPAPSPKPDLPFTAPRAIRQTAPSVPDKVRKSIAGEVVVRVRVNVDAGGRVIAAEPVAGGGPIAEALGSSAVSAVKSWQFEPARRGDEKVPGEVVLSFAFRK